MARITWYERTKWQYSTKAPGLPDPYRAQYDAAMPDHPLNADDIRHFFAAVLSGNADALRRIEHMPAELELSPRGFVFTLPALHTLLDIRHSLDYRDFRKLLYQSTLNRDLGALGAEIVPFASTGKVDNSRYCLQRRERRD